MTLFALTVAKNEEHRYLASMLQNVAEWADVHFVYDDLSTDATFEMAKDAGAVVVQRSYYEPSFAHDEGIFRGRAWTHFEDSCNPREGDWVLVIDCDELLVGLGPGSVRDDVDMVLRDAGEGAVDLRIPEVFGYDHDGAPLVRTDRLWGTIHAPRLFPYRRGGQFNPGKLGAWPQPQYVWKMPWTSSDLIFLMHFGYAEESDALEKYSRYARQPGHASDHVASIVAFDKEVERWNHPLAGTMIFRGSER